MIRARIQQGQTSVVIEADDDGLRDLAATAAAMAAGEANPGGHGRLRNDAVRLADFGTLPGDVARTPAVDIVRVPPEPGA
jgi:hypothetical protein